MEKDSKYQAYATSQAYTIPESDLNYLILLFMKEAEVNMGCVSDVETLERSIYHILKDYGWLPLSYIASAFIRGSLGKFGAGRLVPRTIHGWLFEVGQEYNRNLEKENRREANKLKQERYDLNKFPVGSAIIKKINWYNAGILSIDDWDKVPLKELSERIANNLECYPEIFGLKSIKK